MFRKGKSEFNVGFRSSKHKSNENPILKPDSKNDKLYKQILDEIDSYRVPTQNNGEEKEAFQQKQVILPSIKGPALKASKKPTTSVFHNTSKASPLPAQKSKAGLFSSGSSNLFSRSDNNKRLNRSGTKQPFFSKSNSQAKLFSRDKSSAIAKQGLVTFKGEDKLDKATREIIEEGHADIVEVKSEDKIDTTPETQMKGIVNDIVDKAVNKSDAKTKNVSKATTMASPTIEASSPPKPTPKPKPKPTPKTKSKQEDTTNTKPVDDTTSANIQALEPDESDTDDEDEDEKTPQSKSSSKVGKLMGEVKSITPEFRESAIKALDSNIIKDWKDGKQFYSVETSKGKVFSYTKISDMKNDKRLGVSKTDLKAISGNTLKIGYTGKYFVRDEKIGGQLGEPTYINISKLNYKA